MSLEHKSTVKTDQLYLLDTWKFSEEAKVVSCIFNPQNSQFDIILDRTIFSPQGGGQPSDTGSIVFTNSKNEEQKFQVLDVRQSKTDGLITHTCRYEGVIQDNESVSLPQNTSVRLSVDPEKRRLHARLHSAGHLLDVAVANLGYKFIPGKGYHFADSPYVEYIGSIEAADRDVAKQKLDEEMQRLISLGSPVKVLQSVPFQDVSKYTIGALTPDYLSPDQEVRIVILVGNEGCPCSGTHVKDVHEIGGVKVTKIQKRGKNVRICYQLVD